MEYLRSYCPSCEPDTDPTRELVEHRWCLDHTPKWDGVDDLLVGNVEIPGIGGGMEAGGMTNRRWCEQLHRGKELPILPEISTEKAELSGNDSGYVDCRE
jgi:hypothetical protein